MESNLDKPIIHFQIPTLPLEGNDTEAVPAFSPTIVQVFYKWAKQELGDKAYIVMSPFDIDVINAEVEKVKLDAISFEEFLKKYGYDGELC